MTIEYKDSKRIVALSTDMSSNIVTINHRLSSTDDHAYADLGSALSNSSWVMRYKMVISGYSASNSNPNNSYLFALSKTNTAEQDTQSLGFKLQIGGVGGSVAKVSGNTSSQSSGEGYSGADFTTTVANATWYIECIRNGADFSVRITTNSDYTGGENKTWSTSGTVEDLRYIKYTNRHNTTSSWVLVSTISDIKIYDGVTSATGTFVRDGTWTASASNKVTVATQDTKPTNVQDNSILVEKDTARRYWRSGEVSGSDTNTSQSTYNDISGIGNFDGGWGLRINAGHALVGQEIRSIKVRMRSTGTVNTTNMTARLYGSTKATLRATSTAISSSGLPSSFTDYTFVFPSGSRGVIQAGDHLLIVADALVASGSWNCQIKSSAGTNTHFTTWQQQTNAFTEQTSRELWYDPIVSGTFTPATWTREGAFGNLSELKAYYKFDESSGNIINKASYYDSTDSVNEDLTATSVTYSTAGKIGTAITTGSSGKMVGQTASNFSFISNQGNDWTISLWFKYLGTWENGHAIMANCNSSAQNGFIFDIRSSGNIRFVSIGSINNNFTVGNTDANWHHYALTYNNASTVLQLWVDGVSKGSITADITETSTPDTVIQFGDTDYTGSTNGVYDECSIWNRTLTDAEISTIYNAGSGKEL